MARNDVYLNINALSPADAVVTGQQDMTAATVPELVLGDTPTFNFYFTDNTNVWPSWAGNASYTLTWALSDAVAGDFSPAATTGNATPITGGWSVLLPLNSYDLVGLLNTKRVGQPYPVTNLWQQLRVTDPSGNEVTRAMFWTPVRYRAISDTQNTESASPTGGRFVAVNNLNALTTPTAAQFYSANPVPTSALGTASNGQLLIGNGTGFTKATLTAGTGVSITNGSGSITISAIGGGNSLDDGTAAAPSLKFTNDTDTGLYRPAANTLGVAVGGAQIAYFDANGITTVGAGATFDGSVHAANGNANNPSLSFTSDDNTGFFRHQPDEIGISLGGTQTGTLTASLATLTSKLLVSSGATTTAATDLLVNPAVKASGNLLDLQVASSSKFSVTSAGNGTFGGNLTVSGTAIVSSTAASTSTTTGALVVSGGVGVAGAVNAGGNVTAADVLLGGTSGPSTLSSLSSRAPRDGISFDGTSGARISSTLTNQNLGTDSFSVSMTIEVPTANPSTSRGLWYLSSSNTTNNVANATFAELKTAGELVVYITGAASSDVRTVTLSGFRAAYSGKRVFLTFVRDSSASTMTVYANGVALSGTGGTTGTPPAWSGSVTSTYLVVGNNASGAEVWDRAIYSASLYNLALSASDVVEIYENSGAVPFRYQFGSQVNQIASITRNSDFSAGATDWTLFGATLTGGAISVTSGTSQRMVLNGAYLTSSAFSYRVGAKYRVKANLTGITSSQIGLFIGDGDYDTGLRFANGANSLDATAGIGAFPVGGVGMIQIRQVNSTTGETWTVDDVQVMRIGAVVHFPFNEGAGLTAYDQSTNALNATLTATGVSWAQPSRALVTGGNLTVSGTGTSTINGPLKVLPGAGGGGYLNLNYTGDDVYFETQRWAGSPGIFSATRIMGGSYIGGFLKFLTSNDATIASQVFTERMRLNANGNLLIGTTADGGQKLQVNGTAIVSSTTASTSTTTGALVVSGGVGVAGAVNVGGAIAIGNTVQTAASVASTHKVTISIGGVTYYLLATNV